MGSTAPTSLTRQAPTLGWTDCGHDAWRDGNTLHITYPEGSNMTTARFIVGDSLAVLRTLPDASVDLVLTSPPFMALRSYLPADHADKAMEMGSETTPGAFIDALLDVVEECRRVVAPHGSICVELGDTYSGKGGAGGEWSDSPATTKARVKGGSTGGPPRRNTDTGWPMQKSLSMIPELFRISLAYGINPLTMRETPRWRIRNVVRWVRPNPPVGALGDKFRPGTSEMVVACVSGKRYFDLDAVRGPLTDRAEAERAAGGVVTGESYRADPAGKGYGTRKRLPAPGGGAPPLDWWKIPTAPYKGAHYATFPPALCDRPILAMCPLRVCTTCGEPSRRIVERGALEATESARIRQWDRGKNHDNDAASGGMAAGLKAGGFIPNHVRPATTVGWSDCGHDTWRPGVVLDPFAGSGTALLVATGHGRDAIGIDLDERNVELAIARIGLFLTVEDARPAA
ncbi:MAG TPA: DNA methyltransferase [Acidimicrobiales bacterium]